MSAFNSQPMNVGNSGDYMLLPTQMRTSAGVSLLDNENTVATNPKKSTGKNYQPNGCYRDPMSWLCYTQDGKCVCPMRGDTPK